MYNNVRWKQSLTESDAKVKLNDFLGEDTVATLDDVLTTPTTSEVDTLQKEVIEKVVNEKVVNDLVPGVQDVFEPIKTAPASVAKNPADTALPPKTMLETLTDSVAAVEDKTPYAEKLRAETVAVRLRMSKMGVRRSLKARVTSCRFRLLTFLRLKISMVTIGIASHSMIRLRICVRLARLIKR